MNDIKQTPCAFNESIVSYMYDEMPARERDRFEDHLLECMSCTDEFAAIADARYGVYEWNKEFTNIPTPQFVIPYGETVSFVEKVRRAFAFSWGWPAASAAFASLAVIVGLGYFALLPDTNDMVAVEPVKEVVQAPVPVSSTTSAEVSVKSERVVEPRVEKTNVQPIPVKMTRPAVKRTPVVPQQTKYAGNNRQTPSAPRLNEFNDDVDESLRLAEIFDDVESSE